MNIGILLETKDDAAATGLPPDRLYHYREDGEIRAIVRAVEKAGHRAVVIGPPSKLLEGAGAWRKKADLVLNLSVGFVSRNRLAVAPAILEAAGIPYTGADAFSRTVSQNKHLMKSFLDKLSIPTPRWAFIDSAEGPDKTAGLKYPLFVKPAHEGSSIGIDRDSLVNNREELARAAGRILEGMRMPVIAEEFIAGREVKVGFIGNERLLFKGMIEDIGPEGGPMGGRFLHFSAKKEGLFKKERRDADAPEFHALLEDCKKIYGHFLPADYGTFDVRIGPDGGHYFLEFNADASLHPERTLARCCALNGLGYDGMIAAILESAMERTAGHED